MLIEDSLNLEPLGKVNGCLGLGVMHTTRMEPMAISGHSLLRSDHKMEGGLAIDHVLPGNLHKLLALPPVLHEIEDVATGIDTDADQYHGMVVVCLSASGQTMMVGDSLGHEIRLDAEC